MNFSFVRLHGIKPVTYFATAISVAAASSGIVPAGAQPMPQAPQITVSARGEVQVVPDRARVQLGVETQAKASAAAAADNNRRQAAVLAAIRALGIPAAQIKTLNYRVSPIQRYDEKERRVFIDGYEVSNVIQVVTDKIGQTGAILDAALAAGANRVAGIDFLVRDDSGARDAALTMAIESARRQADVAAKAAGGTLGELLEITLIEAEPRPMLAMARMDAAGSPTPISEGTTTVAASVTTRWRFQK